MCFPTRASSIQGGLFEHLSESGSLSPSLEEISSQLIEDKGSEAFVYGMGPRGAKRWEEFANPHWDRFIEFEREWSSGSLLRAR